jgi:threonylcarbamoyladenosine tRNA methylthiotransferase MtaB
LSNIKGLKSLRISSIEESEIDDKLIDLITHKDNLAKHLHIPLQSGSNRILKLMNRKYNREQFIVKMKRIKSLMPDVMISSDVIVGFPKENEEDFLDTYNLCKECFDMLHVFPYSMRPGTVAAKMDEQISPEVKKQRSKRLLDLSNQLYEKFANRFIDQEVTVLVEKYDKEKQVNIGHTSNYISVEIPIKESKVGEYITVKLQKSMI